MAASICKKHEKTHWGETFPSLAVVKCASQMPVIVRNVTYNHTLGDRPFQCEYCESVLQLSAVVSSMREYTHWGEIIEVWVL